MIGQVAFIIVLGISAYFIRKRVLRIRENIKLGKAHEIKDRRAERFKNLPFNSILGRKKMFKKPLPLLYTC